jgi:hypothetical protein
MMYKHLKVTKKTQKLTVLLLLDDSAIKTNWQLVGSYGYHNPEYPRYQPTSSELSHTFCVTNV